MTPPGRKNPRLMNMPSACGAGSPARRYRIFPSHKADSERNRENANKLPMPVLTVGGTASFGANLAPQIHPLVEQMHSVMIEECGHYLAEE
jgi:hypothetical protein